MKKNILTIVTLVIAGLAFTVQGQDEGAAGAAGQGAGKGKGKCDHAKKILKKLDTDGSGTVSKSEFLAGERVQNLEQERPGAADAIFARRDQNGDGQLDESELKKPHPKRRGGPGKGNGPRPGGKGNQGGGAGV